MRFIDYPAWVRRAAGIIVAEHSGQTYTEKGDIVLPRRKLLATAKLIHNCFEERNEPAAPWSGIPLKHLED